MKYITPSTDRSSILAKIFLTFNQNGSAIGLVYKCAFPNEIILALAGQVGDDFEDGNTDGWKAINGDWEVMEPLR